MQIRANDCQGRFAERVWRWRKLSATKPIERTINGKSTEGRLAVRQALSAPLMAELHTWLNVQPAKLLRHHDLAKAIN